MGVIWDIIKDIPQAAVLKERVIDFEAKKAEAETKIDLLEIDLRNANVQIEQLTADNKRLTEKIDFMRREEPPLHEIAHNILAVFATHNIHALIQQFVIDNVKGDLIARKYYFEELKKEHYIDATVVQRGMPPGYGLTQKGRKYWMDNSSK